MGKPHVNDGGSACGYPERTDILAWAKWAPVVGQHAPWQPEMFEVAKTGGSYPWAVRHKATDTFLPSIIRVSVWNEAERGMKPCSATILYHKLKREALASLNCFLQTGECLIIEQTL